MKKKRAKKIKIKDDGTVRSLLIINNVEHVYLRVGFKNSYSKYLNVKALPKWAYVLTILYKYFKKDEDGNKAVFITV